MSRRAIIQRGDLLRALGVAGPRAAGEERDGVASLCGYQRITEAPPDTFRPPPDEPTERQSLAKGAAEAPGNTSGPVLRAHPEYLVARSAESVAPAPEGDDFEGEWAWLNRSATAEDLEVREIPSTPIPPLMPWARLWPGLRETLGVRRPTGAVDSRALVAAAARLRPLLGRLPRRRRLAWARQATILIDGRPQLAPFREDVAALVDALHACRGREGLEVWCLPEGEPAGVSIRYGTGELGRPRYSPGAPVLAVGDLGCLESGSGVLRRWLELGRSRRRTGGVPAALLPCSPDRWDDRLARLWVSTAWDRGERPRRGGQSAKPRTPGEPGAAGERGARLLDLVSPAVRCEPGLLRRLARLLPREVAGAGDEYDAWNHSEARASDLAMALLPDAAARRRARLAAGSAELRKAVAREILGFHLGCAATVRAAETLNLAEAGALDDPTAVASARQAFERLIARVFETVRERDALRARTQGLVDWCPRGLEQVSTARGGLQLPAAVACAALQHWEGRTVRQTAAELDPAGVSAITDKLLEDPGRDSLWEVFWGAAGLAVRRARSQAATKSDSRFSPGVPVALVPARRLRFDVRVVPRGEGASPIDYRWLPAGDEFAMPVTEAKEIRISTDRARVGLARILCPPWADRFGQDRFGTYAEFAVGTVRFRLRWIPPGTFWMGSPEDEAGRFEDESPQHRVTITRGFWLGETPVTQQQWVALMGNNPSAAKGDLLPVESVDWEMSLICCQRLHERIPELEFRLPTEAEWEYACRAGTQSAFNDGSDCTKPEGTDPKLDRLGWYERNSGAKTHAVREKAPNLWGLYDMHGNVWEWCLDAERRYEREGPNGGIDDPRGAVDTRAGRVVRGGSAWDVAGGGRSAYRFARGPGSRNWFLGFRLAAGQPGWAEPAAEARGAAAPVPEARAGGVGGE